MNKVKLKKDRQKVLTNFVRFSLPEGVVHREIYCISQQLTSPMFTQNINHYQDLNSSGQDLAILFDACTVSHVLLKKDDYCLDQKAFLIYFIVFKG